MSKKIMIFVMLFSVVLGASLALAQDDEAIEADLPADDLAGTSWHLSTMAGETVLSDVLVTLTFDEEGRATGTAGCNRYNTEYTHDDEALTFGLIASTRMFCAPEGVMEQETAFIAALEAATAYEIHNDLLMIHYGDDQILDLVRAKSLVGTQWELVTINQAGLLEDSQVTLQFDEEGNAGGNAGCNSYGGTYTVADDGLTFGMLITTLMACDEELMEQETQYLEILGNIERFRLNHNFTMILTTAEGDELWFEQVHNLLGTAWQLDSIGGQDALADHPISLIFGEFDHAYGSACNQYNAFYEVLGDGEIIFGIVTFTMMYCSDEGVMEQEQAYHGALYSVDRYEVSDDQLVLYYVMDGEEGELIFSSSAPETE